MTDNNNRRLLAMALLVAIPARLRDPVDALGKRIPPLEGTNRAIYDFQ